MGKNFKTFKIKGDMITPVNITEDKIVDMFLEWCEKNSVSFQGVIEDKSKAK